MSGYSQVADPERRYDEAQSCLWGRDAAGRPTHAALTAPGTVSLVEGGGIRRPHPSVLAALAGGLVGSSGAPIETYTSFDVLPGLLPAIRAQFEGWGIPAAIAGNLVLGVGSTHLFNAFLSRIARPGEAVLAPRGFYHAFVPSLKPYGLVMESIPSPADCDFKLTAAGLEAALTAPRARRPACLLLISPTPLGAVYDAAELAALAAVIRRHRLPVFHDAVFRGAEFATGDHAVPGALAEIADLTLTATSVSKIHGCANLRIGWACGPAEWVNPMIEWVINQVSTIPQLVQRAALAALRTPPSYVAENVAEADLRAGMIAARIASANERLRWAYGLAADPVRVAVRPRSGFSILLDMNGLAGMRRPDGGTIAHPLDLTRWFLEQGVGLSPAWSCGFDDFHYRLAFAELAPEAAVAAAAPAELAAILATLAPALALEGEAAAGEALAAAAARIAARPAGDPFAGGRAALLDMIDNRLMPAIEALVAAQGTRAAAPRMVAAE